VATAMTDGIAPLYEVRILSMPIERFAEIAIDGAIWLTGEYLSQGRKINSTSFLNPAYIHKPRHREGAIAALDRANQNLRHRVFVEGFRRLPESGTHGTFEGLLTTHLEMLEDDFQTEWERRVGRIQNAVQSPSLLEVLPTSCFPTPQILVRLIS
jgi:hypothetical protein